MTELSLQDAYKLAVNAHKSGRNIDALNIYEKLLSVLPSNADLHHNVALIHLELCNFKLGEKHLIKAVDLEPEVERHVISLVNFHIQIGKFKQAERICSKAIQKFNHSIKLRELQKKISILTKKRYSLLDVAMNQILSLYKANRLEEAQLACENLLYTFDNCAKIYNVLGAIYTKLRKHDHAITSFNTAIKCDPSFSEAYYNLGNVFNVVEDFKAAITNYQKAISLDAGHVKAYNNIGSCLLALGKVEEAIYSFKKAISISSTHTEAHYNLGNAYSQKNQYDLAIKSFLKALAINPSHVKAYINLAMSYKNIAEFENAERNLSKALEIDQTNVVALNLLGVVYNNSQRKSLALDIFERILRIDPNNVSALFNLAVAYKDISEVKTIDLLKKTLFLQPDYKPALHIFNSLTGIDAKHAPIEYVEQLFDAYADSFDNVLQEELNYCAPDKIKYLINENIADTHHFKTLDIGCGTGLVAKQLKPLVNEIIGIDVSKNMISKANKTGLYNELFHSDIHDFVKNYPFDFDLIVASDVFIYVGELDGLFCELRKHAPSGMYCIFSTEKHYGNGFVLKRSGRFAHSEKYIRSICSKFNIEIIQHFQDKIRMEHGSWVDGDYFLIKFQTN